MVGISTRQDPSGAQGVVLKMTMSGNPTYSAIYSVQATVGQNNQTVSLSVDTGSSDLWIASQDCSSDPCSSSHTTLYDSSTSIPTGQRRDLKYLSGAVSGPVVWESFTLGPYNIPTQAMVAADTVTNEPLSPNFLGLLGLSLPPSSEIARLIPATESDTPDGATVQQNLFGLTPVDTAPTSHFIGITLERSDANHVPSLLTIGKHPTDEIPSLDPSKIGFISLVPTSNGDKWWRVYIESITGWVDGQPKHIDIGSSVSLPSSPTAAAILDTGGPIILATRQIANAIYGAWGVQPASDGNYYLPCTTPMNLTIGLGILPPIPLHPLDLTSLPQVLTPGANTQTCVGLIQASDQLNNLADMVLGVAFMRNVYTVLSSNSSGDSPNIVPRLGLLPLTDPNQAMDEFHSIRVLGESPNSPMKGSSSPVTVGKKLSVGLTVLIAIVGFFILCVCIFGLRFWFMRKRYRKEGAEGEYGDVKRRDETELNEAPFLDSWESDKGRGHLGTDSTLASDYTQVDEHGVVGKRDKSSTASRSSRHSFTGQTDPDRLSDHDLRIFKDHSRTSSADSSSNTTTAPGPLETSDQSPQIRDSTHGRQPSLASGMISFDEEAGMAGVGSRGPTIRPVPRPRLARDASSTSGRLTGFDVGSIFDIDFASSTVGRYPTHIGLENSMKSQVAQTEERRDSLTGLEIETTSRHKPELSNGGGDRIRTYSENERIRGHAHQPSDYDFVDTPLLRNRDSNSHAEGGYAR